MRQLISALTGSIVFIVLLAVLYFPFGRSVIPQIATFFVGKDSIWEIIQHSAEGSQSELFMSNLSDRVWIKRDTKGVFHIKADNWQDAVRGLGYVAAHDRYYQLAFNTRLVAGQLSEWFGESYVPLDKMMLSMGLEQSATTWHNQIGDEEYEIISSYAEGVNGYINNQFLNVKPIEFKLLNLPNRYFRPVDVLRIIKLHDFIQTFSFSDVRGVESYQKLRSQGITPSIYQLNEEVKKVAEKANSSSINALTNKISKFERDLEVLSNIGLESMKSRSFWAQGKRFNNGGSRMAYQISAPLGLPNYYMEVHIDLPDRTVHGLTLPGYPGLLVGSNSQINWAFESSMVDYTNLDLLGDSTEVISSGMVTENTANINPRGAEESPHSYYTINGESTPVKFAEGQAFSFKWPGHDHEPSISLLRDVVLSNDVNTAQKSIKRPVLNHPLGTLTVQDGDEIRRFSTFSRNERSDSYQSWFINATERTDFVQEYEPLPSVNNDVVDRMRSLMTEQEMISNGRWESLLDDSFVPYASIQSMILDLLLGQINNPLSNIIEELRTWDYQADQDARLPKFMLNLDQLVKNELQEYNTTLYRPTTRDWIESLKNRNQHAVWDNPETSEVEGAETQFSRLLAKAYELTVLESGTVDNWSWGQDNKVDLRHQGNHSVFKEFSIMNESLGGFPHAVYHVQRKLLDIAPVYRFNSVLHDKSATATISTGYTGGTSGNPYSEFYDNGNLQLTWNSIVPTVTYADSVDGDFIILYPSR